jgi:hypothetical protein
VILDARMWDKLEATPYGRYNGVEGEEYGMGEEERRAVEEGVRERMRQLGWDEYGVINDAKSAYEQHFGTKSGVLVTGKGKCRAFNIISNQ